MLKKISIGLMGMALMVIFLVIVATLNFGVVNASATDKKTSDLKWVTKNVPGFGNVTAREDMFVGEGNNTCLVLNKDYQEIGVITPIYEKLPVVDTVTVNTPYGNITVTKDEYNKLGKDKIIAEQKAFIEQRNELIKTGKLDTSLENLNDSQFVAKTQAIKLGVVRDQISSLSKSRNTMQTTVVQTASGTFYWSREDYRVQRYPWCYPSCIYGIAYPFASTPLPPSDGTTVYHEVEIHLNNAGSNGETCEIIAQHSWDGRSVWPSMFIDGKDQSMPEMQIKNVNGPIEYRFEYIPSNPDYSGHPTYKITLYNPANGDTRRKTFDVNYLSTRGTYIDFLDPDVEFLHSDPCPVCYSNSNFVQEGAYQGSTYCNPADVFIPLYKTSSQYAQVGLSMNYPSSGQILSTHESGNNVS